MSLPMAVSICLTDHCPLSCAHCFYLQAGRLNKYMLSFKDLEPALDDMQRARVYLVPISGGEPLLHPELLQILEAVKARGMLPLLGTSGLGLKDGMAGEIYRAGVRCVQIGLNGSTAARSDPYRAPGAFSEALGAMKKFQAAGINVNLAFCFDASNFEDLPACLELALAAGAYRVKIEYWKNVGGGRLQPLTPEQRRRGRELCAEFAAGRKTVANWIDSPSAEFRKGGADGVAEMHNKSILIDADGSVRRGELLDPIGDIKTQSLARCVAEDNERRRKK